MSVRLIILILLGLGAAMAVAEPTKVPGTRVTMDPPDGFALAKDFPGFSSKDPRATITVVEVPSSFIELSERYSDDGLRRDGLVVQQRRQLERDGLRAVFLTARETEDAGQLVKVILMTGDVAESLLVTATYQKNDAPVLAAAIDKSLQTLLWDSSRLLDHFDGIGFRLKEIPALRVATRVSNSVIFTRDGTLPDQYYTGKMLIVGWSRGDVSTVADRRAFAEKRFRDVSLLASVEIDNSEAFSRDGAEGFEIVGRGTHRHLGYNVAAFQVMLFYPDRFLLAQGFANSEDPEAAYDEFRTIMSSVSTKD